eukprot:10638463-Alexandrium_andersonii.AAC.1
MATMCRPQSQPMCAQAPVTLATVSLTAPAGGGRASAPASMRSRVAQWGSSAALPCLTSASRCVRRPMA